MSRNFFYIIYPVRIRDPGSIFRELIKSQAVHRWMPWTESKEEKVIGTSGRVEEDQRDYAGYASMTISVQGSTCVFLPAIAQQRGKQWEHRRRSNGAPAVDRDVAAFEAISWPLTGPKMTISRPTTVMKRFGRRVHPSLSRGWRKRGRYTASRGSSSSYPLPSARRSTTPATATTGIHRDATIGVPAIAVTVSKSSRQAAACCMIADWRSTRGTRG